MAKLAWAAEGPIKITKATIDAAWKRRTKDARLVIRDMECRGLTLVVNPTGMAWTYSYKPRGKDALTGKRFATKSITIGNPETHSPDDARQDANRIKGQAKSGADPAAERRAAVHAESRRRTHIISRLIEDYQKALPSRPKLRGTGFLSADYVREDVAYLRLAVQDMQAIDKPVRELTVEDVRRLLAMTKGNTTAPARSRFVALSRFLDWCQELEYIEVNPCALIGRARRPKAPQARAHFLTPEEVARLWRSADQLPEPAWRDIARLLMAVPCRRGEAARMEWSHVSLSAAEWRQPGKLTKNRDPHRLHLHPLALAVLEARRAATIEAAAGGDPQKAARISAADGPKKGLVFPAPSSSKAIDTFTDIKAALSKDAGITGWTWHDFRRSFATALGEAGVAEPVVDAILNHRQAATRGGVLGVYQRASRWPEQVAAMRAWGEMLSQGIGYTMVPPVP